MIYMINCKKHWYINGCCNGLGLNSGWNTSNGHKNMGTYCDAMEAEDRREEGRQAEEELNFVLLRSAARQEEEEADAERNSQC